jgi:hypothetical protein
MFCALMYKESKRNKLLEKKAEAEAKTEAEAEARHRKVG